MPFADYRIAVGHSVALGSLVNVETALANVSDLRPSGRVPRSLPVDLFPVRRTGAAGQEKGGGIIYHQWVFDYFTRNALEYVIDTYLTVSSARVVSRAVTIYTPIDTDEYARFNCYICLPKPGQDYSRNSPGYSPMTIRFNDLIFQPEP
jgi:hypothetical protein